MSPETCKAVSQLFKMLLNCQFSCEQLRRDLSQKKVNLGKAFEFVAGLSKAKAINKEALGKFFEKYYFYASSEDLDNLLFVFDRNKSGIVNLAEFEYELQPKVH